ncbi:MAG: cadherin-like domain-containing protein [Oscillibacter sp.]|jgi:hypothetical protein|nr:cadherin-like domain-containing protein [Oscillibacter sp.]
MKNLFRRGAASVLTAAVLMTVPAMALFGKKTEKTQAQGAPIAQELEIRTYRNIPYHAQFLAVDNEGDDMTYQVKKQPRRGSVTVEGANFVYTPAKDKTGSDSFTFVATDSAGHKSSPATVDVTVDKVKSGVSYADMSGSAAAAAAQQLAEEGIFTGSKIGGQYFFEPERTVSRGEFLAMTMESAGMDASAVTMTGFSDDAAIPTWAKAYAASGLSDGVVQGCSTPDGPAFRASDAVTYNEAAAILNRVLSVRDVDLDAWYADRNAAPSWAAQAVGNMESVSVLAAGSFGSSGLDRSVTRADAARMLAAAQTLMAGDQKGVLDWIK